MGSIQLGSVLEVGQLHRNGKCGRNVAEGMSVLNNVSGMSVLASVLWSQEVAIGALHINWGNASEHLVDHVARSYASPAVMVVALSYAWLGVMRG